MNSLHVSPFLREKIRKGINRKEDYAFQMSISPEILQKIKSSNQGSVQVSLDTAKKISRYFGVSYSKTNWEDLNGRPLGFGLTGVIPDDKNATLKELEQKREMLYVLMREIVELENMLIQK